MTFLHLREELLNVLAALEVPIDVKEFEDLFDDLDSDKKGSVDFEEFLACKHERQSSSPVAIDTHDSCVR